ncbi:MAG: hypothetical protein GX234_12155 [Clostridiales bacterium]|nr:hypothetical protein [Clostridiales bacterium]
MSQKRMQKKGRRRRIRMLLVLLGMMVGTGGYFYRGKRIAEAEAEETEMTAGENQWILYGEITDIIGNEMELSILRESRKQDGTFIAAGEQKVYQIPVGTEVETKLGAITTFSRLASKDRLKILLEEDGADGCILKIEIVE